MPNVMAAQPNIGPKLPNRFQPSFGRRSPYCGYIWRRYCCL